MHYKAVVIGASAGGIAALGDILEKLPPHYPLPILVVQHKPSHGDERFWIEHFTRKARIPVKIAQAKRRIKGPGIYISPGGYHLLVEMNETISLSVDPPECHSIPSIDVLFESAAYVYKQALVGVILTGANRDGSAGIAQLKKLGGLAIVQDPGTAQSPEMPQAAMASAAVDHVLPLNEIGPFLASLASHSAP